MQFLGLAHGVVGFCGLAVVWADSGCPVDSLWGGAWFALVCFSIQRCLVGGGHIFLFCKIVYFVRLTSSFLLIKQ